MKTANKIIGLMYVASLISMVGLLFFEINDYGSGVYFGFSAISFLVLGLCVTIISYVYELY